MADIEDILNNVLEKVKKEQGYENGETWVKKVTTNGANFTSFLFRGKISKIEKNNLNLFIKVAVANEQIREFAPNDIFETENVAYKKILTTYKNLEDKHNVPIEHRLVAPKFYASSKEYMKEAIVLEDLSASGYTTLDRTQIFNWEYASKSIENLAKLHALSISFSIENPEEFEKVPLFTLFNKTNGFENYLKTVLGNALAVTKEENKSRLSKFMNTIGTSFEDGVYFKPIRRPVIAHGDYRPSNLMHKINEDGTMNVVSLDYQTLQRGNPIIDLVYFIFTGSDKNFRKKYFRQTLDRYYNELCAALRRLHLDPNYIYSRKDFDHELKQVLPFGLVSALFCLILLTVDDENAPKVSNDLNLMEVQAMIPNKLFEERLNDVIDDYIDMGVI